MHTIELDIAVGDDWQELLVAELLDLGFEAFEQDDTRLRAYIPAARWSDTGREAVEAWLRTRGLPAPPAERVIAPQNWNRQWEETIRPLVVGPFLVKPTWADVPPEAADLILLEIDPKMSFGTGYHESTRLALRFLPGLVGDGERVLDAGTGTGILAIAALRLGAASAVAFDIDEWAQENAVENFYLNGVADRADFRAGDLATVPETGFDLVLANIQRNVLVEMMPGFARRLRPGGRVVLAGLLQADRPAIAAALAAAGFAPEADAEEGEWWACTARFTPEP